MLAHNYQPREIQDLADLCGDSLELSIKASRTDADVILFCGVNFMAETASVLSPQKTVLLPNHDAGCPMADMITPEDLKVRMAELGPMPVVTYVNSPASVKALSTICCTSANAVLVINSLDADEVLMTPDRNLARNTAVHTAKKIHLWDGCCPIHDLLTPADAALSTSGMIRYAQESDNTEFIVATETGMLYPLSKANPDKRFYAASERMICTDMKKIALADIVRCLENMEGRVKVPEDIREPALAAVQRMINLSI